MQEQRQNAIGVSVSSTRTEMWMCTQHAKLAEKKCGDGFKRRERSDKGKPMTPSGT